MVGEGVVLGEGVSIQPFAVIEDGAKIGARTVIGRTALSGTRRRSARIASCTPRVTVGARCLLGNRVIIHSGAVLGSDGFGFEFQGGRHVKIPQIGHRAGR